MGSYEDSIDTLETELNGVHKVFAGLTADEWKLPTKLVHLTRTASLDDLRAGRPLRHLDRAHRMLVSSLEAGQPGRDGRASSSSRDQRWRRSFTTNAYTMVEGKSPADMRVSFNILFRRQSKRREQRPRASVRLLRPDGTRRIRAKSDRRSGRSWPRSHQRPGRIRLPLERDRTTAEILDQLLARRTVPGRPPTLTDDMA